MADRKEYMKQWYIDNKKKIDKQHAKYKLEHKEEIKKNSKQYRQGHREEIKQYYQDNKEILDEKHKQWRKNNPDKIRQYRQNHRLEINDWNLKYKKKKRETNLHFNLCCRMKVEIYNTLKCNKRGRHWESLVEYTSIELKKHLEKTMPKDYAWRDYLEGKLHIDHIMPISAHNFTKPEHTDFKRCWALKNLQLLPAKENLIKNSKLSKPFQPALQI